MNYNIEEKLPEEIYSLPKNHIPLVVFDFQVHAHAINSFLENIFIHEYDESIQDLIIKSCWAVRLNRGPDMIPQMNFTGLIVDDYKVELDDSEASTSGFGYWRHIVAKEHGLQEYKLGRATHTDLFNRVKIIGYEYILAPNSTFFYYRQELMEADDIAGKLARIKRNSKNKFISNRHMFLWTVDGDWQGLVNNKFNIFWANTGPWLPRLRDEQAVCDYYLRKNKVKIDYAYECYIVKADQGDLGDGLIAGSPFRLFDLIDEDYYYNFSENQTEILENILFSKKISNRLDHYESARDFLSKLGLFIPITPPSDEKTIEAFHEKAKIEREKINNPPIKGRFKKVCEEIKIVDDDIYKKCKDFSELDNKEKDNLSIAKKELEKCDRYDSECIRYFKILINNIKKTREVLKKNIQELSKLIY